MTETLRPVPAPTTQARSDGGPATHAPFARSIGRTRFVVLIAVVAVLMVSITLFLLGAYQAVLTIWHALQGVSQGGLASTSLTVESLEVVSIMLKAVVFYIVGVGLYSLFIAPLNVTAALGVETIHDLETKVVSVVIVIMAVTFLEHFIAWQQPAETLMFGGTMALVVLALVLFQFHSQRAKEQQAGHDPDQTTRAQRQLFQGDREERHIEPDQAIGGASEADRR